MFFQDAPPDTSSYMILGYAVFFGISIIYLISLAIRRRNLERDLQTLESIEAESNRPDRRKVDADALWLPKPGMTYNPEAQVRTKKRRK